MEIIGETKCSILCVDFHGVLTDGRISITSDGNTPFELVHVKDIAAIREFIANGWEVYVVTSSKSPVIDAYCEKVGCVKIQSRLKRGLFEPESYIYIGDSAFDLDFLQKSYKAYCPADAESTLLSNSDIIKLKTSGGKGCIAEILEYELGHNRPSFV